MTVAARAIQDGNQSARCPHVRLNRAADMRRRVRTLGTNERIVFQAGTHNVTMAVAYADFERLARPTLATFAVAR